MGVRKIGRVGETGEPLLRNRPAEPSYREEGGYGRMAG